MNAGKKLLPEKEIINWNNNLFVQFLFLTTVPLFLLSLKTISITGSLRRTPSSSPSTLPARPNIKKLPWCSTWTKHWSIPEDRLHPITLTTSPQRYLFQNPVQRIKDVRIAPTPCQAVPEDSCRDIYGVYLHSWRKEVCGLSSQHNRS